MSPVEGVELLPCPFCGSVEIDVERNCAGEIEVQCLGDCGALIVATSREAAVALWNRRVAS